MFWNPVALNIGTSLRWAECFIFCKNLLPHPQRQNGYRGPNHEINRQFYGYSYGVTLAGRLTPSEIHKQRSASPNQCARYDRPGKCRQDEVSPKVIFPDKAGWDIQANSRRQCFNWSSCYWLHWWVHKCFSSHAHSCIFGLCGIRCISWFDAESAQKSFSRAVDKPTCKVVSTFEDCKDSAPSKCLYSLPPAPSPEDQSSLSWLSEQRYM